MNNNSLYERLGGYDGITGFVNDLLPRLKTDRLLSRFWENRSDDGVAREKQLLIDFISKNSGGSTYYSGRDMKLSHKGMKINENDWEAFIGHAVATMKELNVQEREGKEIALFVTGLKQEIVEA